MTRVIIPHTSAVLMVLFPRLAVRTVTKLRSESSFGISVIRDELGLKAPSRSRLA
jgi:hypothetical protein